MALVLCLMAFKKRYAGTAKSSKYYKCKRCYSSGQFCTHSSGTRGSAGSGKGYTSRRTGSTAYKKTYSKFRSKTTTRKKAPEPTKIDVPVLNSSKNAVPEMVPLNGVRVRCTRLTDITPVRYESKKFTGSVCWRGVTDAFNYEMNGEGPFLHRRILFQGPAGLSWDDVKVEKLAVPASSWWRSEASSLDDKETCDELRRMFGTSATVRDILFSPVKAHGYNIVADSRKQLEGKASGTRKYQKYWKGFGKTGKGIVLKYEMSENGVPTGELADGEKYMHIYAMDIFQYGINGLDNRLPGSASAGTKRAGDELSKGSSKRPKSEDSYVESMDGLELGSGYIEEEKCAKGVVRVLSNMKLYWYDPK